MVFNPEKFEVRCDDGTVLPRTDDVRRFLTCLHRLQGASDLDLLASAGTTRSFFLELTRNCNLRCVYCAVSQPWYEGKDMDVTDFDDLVQMIKARQVNTLLVNGHGETTTIHGWHHKIVSLADAGFRLSMISNFARLLTDEELAAMARISQIEISVDTHRPDVLRAVRRKVDLGNILINMANVTSTASKLGLPRPQFSWSCVVSDRVALDLADYVRFGLACGVRNFTLCNLTKYDDIKDGKNVRHVTTLPREDLKRFLDLLEQVRAMVSAAGGNLTIWSGLVDSIHQQLALQEVA
jgi:MoaA/NifB/PqqE/SkfB family radical SAM enzyme